MSQHNLGRLERVEPRSVWRNEAGDFTPWLAQVENLSLLGETIGLELDLDSQERWVGPFRADIVCKDSLNDSWVLIENQLERTDHSHLGQLLTYAAGLNAVTIVWIAHHFTEEHRAALDWLNEVTDEEINFFGLEIELWRIGDSAVAPKFNIISKPNNWTKVVAASRRQSDELTDVQQLYLDFWQEFIAILEQQGSILKSRKPKAHYGMIFSIGRANMRLEALLKAVYGQNMTVRLVIDGQHSKAYYQMLYEQKAEIETALGTPLEWNEQPDTERSTIALQNPKYDPNNREQWPQQYAWLQGTLEAFYRTFSPRLRQSNTER